MHASGSLTAPVNGRLAARSFQEYGATNYFGALDGLRALAIGLVLLHHCPRFESGLPLILQENGRHGVSLFFVISGYLICTLLLRERQQSGRIALGNFYARRAARLLPLYYAVLALHAVAVFGTNVFSAEGEQLFREKLPSYLFYYSNWLPTATQGPFFYAWSLAVEEQFYLCFALLLAFARHRVVIAIAAAAVLLKFAVYQFVGAVDVVSAAGRVLFSYQEPILLGVLLGFALNHRPAYERLARWLGTRIALPAVALLLAGSMVLHPLARQSAWDAQVLFILMALTVAACVVRRAPRWLESGLLAHIGKVSYGIYLLHWLVLVAVARLLPPSAWFPVECLLATLLIVVVLASAVHRFFEAPIIAYFKRRQRGGDVRPPMPLPGTPAAAVALPPPAAAAAPTVAVSSLPRV